MGEDSDKTEEPTEHKLQEAKKKGQVFKSQDITSTLLLLVTAAILGSMGAKLFWSLGDYMRWVWSIIPTIPQNPINERNNFADGLQLLIVFFKNLTPLFAAAFVVAIFGNLAQVKFIFSTEPLQPKLSKISPIEGFKKIFSVKSLIEMFKQIAKLVVIGYIVYKIVKSEIMNLSMAIQWDIYQTTTFLKSVVKRIIMNVLVGMTALSIIDYIIQRQQFMKQMKMSIQELKDEYKDTEGNPQVKGKMKQLMRQASMGRMMGDAAGASAVITNPTHLAVAVRYRQGEDKAPVVVAKGERLIAVQIKVIAEENEIPIVENVELARALFGACEVGSGIPPELYKATAEVLAYVFKLKKKREMKKKMARRASRRAG
ncbi:MAG: flagellar biosynthesis protein FlhB [Candidatus Eremiobacteraeota bacterium]|nr:flagellar biosynthesis protein FlhB [Candidatus Eremiobacteraeota bacterium]